MGKVKTLRGSVAGHDRDWMAELEACLMPLDDTDLHCHGVSYCVAAALSASGIRHELMGGYSLQVSSGDIVFPHCWIALPRQNIFDLRLRMWLGDDDDIPHGLFQDNSAMTHIHFKGRRVLQADYERKDLDMMSQGVLSSIQLPPPPAWAR